MDAPHIPESGGPPCTDLKHWLSTNHFCGRSGPRFQKISKALGGEEMHVPGCRFQGPTRPERSWVLPWLLATGFERHRLLARGGVL